MPLTKERRFRVHESALYLVDNGACYCGAHLGASARHTGRDLSGQAIYRIPKHGLGDDPALHKFSCERCDAAISRLLRDGFEAPPEVPRAFLRS
jgi:hypothetical protein